MAIFPEMQPIRKPLRDPGRSNLSSRQRSCCSCNSCAAVPSFLVVNILAYLHSLSCFSELFDRSLALTLQLAGKQAQAFGEGCKPYGQDLFKLGIHVLVHLVYRLERYYRAAQQQRQGDDVFHSDKLSQSSIPLFWQLLLCWTPNGRIRRGGI